MKILAIGDIHGDSTLTQKIAELAKENDVDLIVITGDLTNFDQFDKGMIQNLVKSNKKVVFVPGNHDDPITMDVLSETYKIKNIHGYGMKLNDKLGMFGCSAVNVGEHSLEDKEIFDMLDKSHKYVKSLDKKIMVTHVQPTGTIMDKLNMFDGSEAVTKAVKEFQPDILLCAHSHEAKGIEEKIGKTKVINVSKEPKIIDL